MDAEGRVPDSDAVTWEDRLLAALASCPERSPQPLVDGIRAEITAFADDLRDDIQVLVVRRNG